MKKLVIAIDGPAGAGKSTVAKIIADELNYTYIDTGAMYRVVALETLRRKIDPAEREQVAALLPSLQVRLEAREGNLHVCLQDEDVSDEIRTPEVTAIVSQVAAYPEVRERLVSWQREMAQEGGVVMDGRDIGTVVLPHADLKLFLTASPLVRAQRRLSQWQAQGKAIDTDIREMAADIERRDRLDSEREVSPLVQAEDAVLLDNSEWTTAETVEKILNLVRQVQTSVSQNSSGSI